MNQLEIALELTKLTLSKSTNDQKLPKLSTQEINNLINELYQNSYKTVREVIKN